MEWGLGGFILGVALSAVAVGALGYSSTSISSLSLKSQPDMRRINAEPPAAQTQRLMLFAVKSDELDGAIATMDLPAKEQRAVRHHLENHEYRLLWLTLWDWDSETTTGDTISITSDNYHRLLTLRNRRSKIAIPEPRSGYIELRGERTEDGIIAISLLSGAQPIAVPRMSVGQAVKLEIDTP